MPPVSSPPHDDAVSVCETAVPAVVGPLFIRDLSVIARGGGLVARAASIPLALTRVGPDGALEVDTYRLDHPRRRRPGGPGDWAALGVRTPWLDRPPTPRELREAEADGYQLGAILAQYRPIRLEGAPPAVQSAGAPSGSGRDVECAPARDAWRVIAAAYRPEREASARAQWLARATQEPGPTPTQVEPRDGEGWIDAFAAIGDELEDAFPDLDAAGRRAAAIEEVTTDAHGARWDCAQILAEHLAAWTPGPLRLDARPLVGVNAHTGISWLRRVVRATGARPVLVALPAAWGPYALTTADRVWDRADDF